ncbi:unnamed protein product [Psylliodes chrysocephalus]|uniref:Uncharacterized protein n=1 Tax=Psylliodes chrysocephalus TaxID=3402493 RepID=A0A9P0GK10_9CUCU|nr:unnamed protein product [Psylliodes chrysocephala]
MLKKVPSQTSTSSFAIEQPSTSADSSIINDTIVHDSLVKDVNLHETEEVEKEIDAQAEQPLEAGPSEDLAESSTIHTSENVALANLNVFFCNKKRNNIALRIGHYALQGRINLKRVFY